MTTKKGEPIPEELSQALQSGAGLLEKWNALRPSCQREHAKYVAEAKGADTRQRRVARVLRMTEEWCERHPPMEAKRPLRS